MRVESNQPGELEVSWDAPAETPNDYRVAWARVDDEFPTWRNPDINAYPTTASYTISGLDEGVGYNLWLRARYGAGDWTGPHEAVVATAPTSTATATPVPTATAVTNSRTIAALRVAGGQPGALQVSWDPPTESPRDYRVMWARVGESFPSYRDNDGNAYPTSSSHTITGLDQGVRYKVKVRARYSDNPGDWSDQVEADVPSQ